MPYNLRKRPAAPDPPPVVKRPTKKLKKETAPKIKRESIKEAVEEPVEECAQEIIKETTKRPVKESNQETDQEIDIKEKKPSVKKPNELLKEDRQKHSAEPSSLQLMFGVDSCGEFGAGKIGITKKIPFKVPINKPLKQVACGPMHTLSLTEDGHVYSYGCNDEGALGRVTDGDEDLEATPTLVPNLKSVVKITAGDSHSAVLTDTGKVFVWGNFRDEHGSVGLTPACGGKLSVELIPILPDLKLRDIASGSNHMLILDEDGNIYSFGVGAQGQLGRISPEELGHDGCRITEENRDIFLNPHKVSLKNVDPQRPFICDAIFAGNFSSFATNTDKKKNRLAGWGLNNYYQLGYKGAKGQLIQHFPKRSTFTCSTSMIHVACGQHHTLFLTKTGRVYVAGRHEYGMLGLGKLDKEVCPAKHVDKFDDPIVYLSAAINTSFAVSSDGKLFSWGMGGYNLGLQNDDDLTTPTEVTSVAGKKVVSVSAGGSFTAIIVDASDLETDK